MNKYEDIRVTLRRLEVKGIDISIFLDVKDIREIEVELKKEYENNTVSK